MSEQSAAGASPAGVANGSADADISVRPVDAVVLGRTLPTLIAALELAEVGMTVVVAGTEPELPTAPERDPEGAIAAALERVAAPIVGSDARADGGTGTESDTGSAPVTTPSVAPQLLDPSGAWAPQSDPSVWGIPAVPLSVDTLRLLGTRAGMRAYLDRIMPLLTIGKTRELGVLARKRLGREAWQRLVDPLVRERFGVPADAVEVAIAAPGLNEALSRAGSLTGAALAYAERYVARETTVAPAGGWAHAAQALVRRLAAYGVEFSDSPPAASHASPEGGWRVALADGSHFQARALIADPGARLDGAMPDGVLPPQVRSVSPLRTRVYAEIDIRPESAAMFDSGDTRDAAGDRAVAVRSLGDWSLRLGPVPPEPERASTAPKWRAHLSGPARSADSGGDAVADAGSAVDSPGLDELLAAAGVVATEGAAWRTSLRAAPFATLQQRDAAAEKIATLRAQEPELLVLGSRFHGDDLSTAVSVAVSEGVALRRHLLGLTD